MSGAVFSIWIVIAFLLYATNRDVCSPAKILHVYALVFFLGFFWSRDTVPVTLSYIVILLSIATMGVYEALSLRQSGMPFRVRRPGIQLDEKNAYIVILSVWILSCLPLLAQAYMVSRFGGFAGYFPALALRVKEFAGFGPVLSVIKILPILNVLYFAVIVTAEKSVPMRRTLFLLHLGLTIAIGLMSGSRSLVLMNFFWMILLWNYLRRPWTASGFAAIGVSLVAAGLMLGTVRDLVSYSGISAGDFGETDIEQILSTTARQLESSATTNSGLEGMRLLYDAGVDTPQFGLTLLTGLTNFVPRVIWPDKPRTGGLVLTQDYAGDAWSGYSNLSTGIYTESMINFGTSSGFIIGMLLMFAMFVGVNHLYQNIVHVSMHRPPLRSLAEHLRYIWVVQAVAGMLLGEFANGFVNIVLQLTILWGALVFVRLLGSHVLSVRPVALEQV